MNEEAQDILDEKLEDELSFLRESIRCTHCGHSEIVHFPNIDFMMGRVDSSPCGIKNCNCKDFA